MTYTSAGDLEKTIAHLETEIEKLNALVRPPATARRRRSWRRPMALVGVAVLAVGMLAGVAGASGTTTNVTFVPLSPAKVILSNVNIGANKTSSAVVIGGTTTVPSNATTVQLTVTAKGASIGTLNFYPTLNPSGGSGQTLAYPGSNVAASTTIQENVGQASSLTFANSGIGTATVTAKITGYSTQVTAGDINGVGGTNGQVLTNDGAGGAAWTTPPVPSATNFSTSGGTDGQVLTNTGTGAAWSNPTVSGYQIVSSAAVTVAPNSQNVGSASCPTGKVAVGGGVFGFGGITESVNGSYPSGASGWVAYVNNTATFNDHFTVYVICVD